MSRHHASGGRSRALDAVLAGASFAAMLLLFVHGVGGSGATHAVDAGAVALAAAAAVPLLAWRRAPLAVFIASAVPSIAAMLLGYPGGPPIPATVALFLLAQSRDERHPWTARTSAIVGAVFVLHITAFGIGEAVFPGTQLLSGAVVWALAWFAGERVRLRRAQVAQLEQRALRAEQEAARERQLAAAEERARIARDLHDSAGHAINVIAVHAGAARLLHEQDPERARAAIETIERVARQTVDEIDQIVRRLRSRSGAVVEAPPGLAALDTLVEQHRNAGTAVTLTRSGVARQLPSPLDQAAYRILQEALTNAARHGQGSARVEVTFTDGGLELSVVNPAAGDGLARAGGGHGLVGMSERAVMLGGTLEAGRSNGSFQVRASLPYRGQ